MRIFSLDEIKSVLNKINLVQEIEDGFIAYSNGDVIVPPVGELHFESPPGDVHIKYGYIKNDNVYVIKIASGFFNVLITKNFIILSKAKIDLIIMLGGG